MAFPVIISYNSANPKELPFVEELQRYLSMRSISAVAGDPKVAEPEMQQELSSAQWLVLVLTPNAIRSPRVQSLVNTAFDYVKHGRMQGILALTFLSNPVEPEDMPSPWWSTIRTYYTGESDEDHRRTFEKVSRTLRVPVYATSPSADNWGSPPGYRGSASSRPLPVPPQSTKKPHPGLMVPVLVFALLIILLSFGATTFILNRSSATRKPNVAANAAANKTSTAIAMASATAHANATATASVTVTKKAQDIYTNTVDPNKLHIPMYAQDQMQQWEQNDSCKFTSDGMYHVTNTNAGQYTPCMAKKSSFKNFAYQVQMQFNNGGFAGGLIFRSNQNVTKFYRFSLNNKGEYALFGCQQCVDTKIGDDASALIHGNIAGKAIPNAQSYTLTVIAMDKIIYLYVNETFVDQLMNSTITDAGEIGVYAASSEGQSTTPTQVTFSNAQVWKLP